MDSTVRNINLPESAGHLCMCVKISTVLRVLKVVQNYGVDN